MSFIISTKCGGSSCPPNSPKKPLLSGISPNWIDEVIVAPSSALLTFTMVEFAETKQSSVFSADKAKDPDVSCVNRSKRIGESWVLISWIGKQGGPMRLHEKCTFQGIYIHKSNSPAGHLSIRHQR
jgi:hypothetical protein